MLAGSASSAEGFAFREDMLGPADHCTPLAYPALSAVRFNDVPEYLSVPVNQTSEVLSPVTDKAREYQKHYPVDYRAKPCTQALRESQAAAKMLRASILQLEAGVRTKCKYECETEFGCMHCIPGNMTVSCPAKCRRDNFTPTIEWIGDTGSAQDLISEHDLEGHPSRISENPINIMTANGPSSADQQIKVNVPSLGIEADPYVLPSTPSVLSIGYRCMEQGFDFIWKACCRPYFRDKKGNKIFLDVRDNVPYLKSWHENISVPARPAPQESAAGKPAQSASEALASQLAKDHDFSVAACQKLLASVKFKKDTIQRSVVQGKKGKSEYIILGVYAHGGIQGITRKSDDHPKLTEYLCRFLKHHGASDHFSSICINHGSSIKVHKDIHNKTDTTNVTMSMGDFQGGGLWIHDKDLREGDGQAVKRKLPDGNFAYGKILEEKGKLITFNPKSFHRVEPWKGDRWSITAYVNRACHKLQNEERDRLSKLGFVLPSKASVPAPPKHDPDDDLTLFEFAESDKTTPKAVEPRVKPKVKLKAEPKRKEEKKSSAPEPPMEEPLPGDADYIRKLIEEGRTDDEGEAPSSASRPPGGEAGVPDEEARPDPIPPPPPAPSGGSEVKRSRSVEALKKEAKSAKHLLTHIPKSPYCEICIIP